MPTEMIAYGTVLLENHVDCLYYKAKDRDVYYLLKDKVLLVVSENNIQRYPTTTREGRRMYCRFETLLEDETKYEKARPIEASTKLIEFMRNIYADFNTETF